MSQRALIGIVAIMALVAISPARASAVLGGDMQVSVHDSGGINSIRVYEPIPCEGLSQGFIDGLNFAPLNITGNPEFYSFSALEWGSSMSPAGPQYGNPYNGVNTDTSTGSISSALTQSSYFPAQFTQTISYPTSGPGENTISVNVKVSNPSVYYLHNLRYARGIVPAMGAFVETYAPNYLLTNDMITAVFEANRVTDVTLSSDVTFALEAGSTYQHVLCLSSQSSLPYRSTDYLSVPHSDWDGQHPQFMTMSLLYEIPELGPGQSVDLKFNYIITVPEPSSLAGIGLVAIGLLKRRR